MILLDTDHTAFLKYPDSERGRRMIDRLDAASASEVIGVAIVTVEERMRGWLAAGVQTPRFPRTGRAPPGPYSFRQQPKGGGPLHGPTRSFGGSMWGNSPEMMGV